MSCFLCDFYNSVGINAIVHNERFCLSYFAICNTLCGNFISFRKIQASNNTNNSTHYPQLLNSKFQSNQKNSSQYLHFILQLSRFPHCFYQMFLKLLSNYL